MLLSTCSLWNPTSWLPFPSLAAQTATGPGPVCAAPSAEGRCEARPRGMCAGLSACGARCTSLCPCTASTGAPLFTRGAPGLRALGTGPLLPGHMWASRLSWSTVIFPFLENLQFWTLTSYFAGENTRRRMARLPSPAPCALAEQAHLPRARLRDHATERAELRTRLRRQQPSTARSRRLESKPRTTEGVGLSSHSHQGRDF